MKIKRKEYNKKLDDAYWNGVQAGMKYAVENPKSAEKYADDIQYMRTVCEKAYKALKKLAKHIAKSFEENNGE